MFRFTAMLLVGFHFGCAGKSTSSSTAAPYSHAGSETSAAQRTQGMLGEGEAATASVSFASPADGASTPSPVHVEMGVQGMEVKPAGEIAAGAGHHHIIVDGEPIPLGQVVPMDDTHIHFGKGQTETDLELSAGSHTLTLQFADGAHVSYGPDMSATITVTVEAAAEGAEESTEGAAEE